MMRILWSQKRRMVASKHYLPKRRTQSKQKNNFQSVNEANECATKLDNVANNEVPKSTKKWVQDKFNKEKDNACKPDAG